MTLLDEARNDGCPRPHVLVGHFVEQLEGVWKMAAFGVHVEEIVVEVEGREKGLLYEFGVHGFAVPQVVSFDEGAENARGLFDLCSRSERAVWFKASSRIMAAQVLATECDIVLSWDMTFGGTISELLLASVFLIGNAFVILNSLREVKDQAEDKANPKPWYTADEKSSKMSTKDLQDLIREYPLPEGWYARLPGLGEPANYGTKFETGVYEEQVKSGYRLPLHPFALRFFEHYCMAPGQLVPNGWRKIAGLIYLVQTSGYKPDVTDFMRVFFEVYFVKGVANCPGWRDDLGMPDSQVLEQHLRHGILPRDKEVFQNQTHETFACSFAQAVYTMYASGSEMFSRFEMARQVAAEEAQLTRESVKEAQEATHRAEELSKREEDHLDWIASLEKKLDRVKKRAAEEVIKARDQGIHDFLEGNAGDEWLKKRTEDGLEIYELGCVKAKEMFAERFLDILCSACGWVTIWGNCYASRGRRCCSF
ncbi:hypothetical protein RJ640_020491 [Escallonia rubra]|uniref:Transposase (putative) gypsy type domain-containing protein n=1 Tax=Escallonia rubra TaxID=112253 RepID=A0AA88R131_9ASTE|nr:hypothetical protein RJ640_020491 [Escallonia rubra]